MENKESYTLDTMATGDLAMQGARTSAAMVLAWISWGEHYQHYPRIKTWITNGDFQMQLLIGCQQSCQPIKSHIRKSPLVNHNFIPG